MSIETNGHLFVVGGAEDRKGPKEILRQFLEAAGGPNARIVVDATASSIPEVMLAEYDTAFKDLGAQHVDLIYQERRSVVPDESRMVAISQATGIYFTGGDQLKLTSILGGTEYATMVRQRFAAGAALGGTSAGASAMSTFMIARGRGKRTPRLSSVRLSPGLSILPHIIVDQHFQERDRFGRLITAVLKNPSQLGFGVDEDTAFVLDSHGRVEVIGKGTLTIVDGSELCDSNIAEARDHEPLAFAGIKMHALAAGWTFDVQQREVRPPTPGVIVRRHSLSMTAGDDS